MNRCLSTKAEQVHNWMRLTAARANEKPGIEAAEGEEYVPPAFGEASFRSFHPPMFEVAEAIVAAGEMEAAVEKMKVNERQKKCRAKAK